MQKKQKQFEPAFPSHCSMGEIAHEGMSLRDWLAGMALQQHSWQDTGSPKDINAAQANAEYAYAIADAMLKEREK